MIDYLSLRDAITECVRRASGMDGASFTVWEDRTRPGRGWTWARDTPVQHPGLEVVILSPDASCLFD